MNQNPAGGERGTVMDGDAFAWDGLDMPELDPIRVRGKRMTDLKGKCKSAMAGGALGE